VKLATIKRDDETRAALVIEHPLDTPANALAADHAMLRFYRLGSWRAPLLPVVALLYAAMTIDSAWQHRRGGGGAWKGRTR
jgi:hypothetical protein